VAVVAGEALTLSHVVFYVLRIDMVATMPRSATRRTPEPHLTLSVSAGPVVILALVPATLRHLPHRRGNRQRHAKTDGCVLHRLRRSGLQSGCVSPRPSSRSVRCSTAPSMDGGRVLLANRGLLQRMQTPPPPLFDRADCSFKSPLQRASCPDTADCAEINRPSRSPHRPDHIHVHCDSCRRRHLFLLR
jgi:ABC-type nickel/cobalt efflux system permease component RcnA